MARDAATASFQVGLEIPGETPREADDLIVCVQFNHTMLRVKDPAVSLKFYKEVSGMSSRGTNGTD